MSVYCNFNSAVGAAWQSGGIGSAWESNSSSRLMPDRTECTHRVAPQARGALAGSGIYTRRCTRCTPLCHGMLPDVNTYSKIKLFLISILLRRLVAFRSRGAYVWYNISYKCKIRGVHSVAEGCASGTPSGRNATGSVCSSQHVAPHQIMYIFTKLPRALTCGRSAGNSVG